MRPGLTLLLIAVVAAAAGCGAPPVEAPAGSYTPTRFEVNVAGADRNVDGAIVTPDFFNSRAVRPMLGRLFTPDEYKPGQAGVVVLAHKVWADLFQSRPDVIGTTITVQGRPRVIIGVAPPDFEPAKAGLLWIPKTD